MTGIGDLNMKISLIFAVFDIYEQFEFYAQLLKLSKKKFNNLGARLG